MDLSNDNIIHIKKNGVEYLQFKRLLAYEKIKHAYALNDLDYRKHGDNDAKKSYEKLLKKLEIDFTTLVKPHQTHTDNILIIGEKKNLKEPDMYMDYLENVDGMITNSQNITLTSTNADCILLLMYDPLKKVIASIHSGWKGTFKKISKKAIEMLKEKFDCDAKDIIVCICPSIRVCHFEVDEDVKEECKNIFSYFKKLDDIIKIGQVKDGKQKYYIDTILITKILLEEEGIKKENIIDSNICSVCSGEKVHSRRVEGIDYGLGCAIITQK